MLMKHRFRVKGWGGYSGTRSCKGVRIAILLSAKANYKSKLVKRGKENHYILLNGTIHQEDITVINTLLYPIL